MSGITFNFTSLSQQHQKLPVTFHFPLSFIPPHIQLILSISIPFKIRPFKIKHPLPREKKKNATIIKFNADGGGIETKDAPSPTNSFSKAQQEQRKSYPTYSPRG